MRAGGYVRVCVCGGVRRVALRCKTKLLGYRMCVCVCVCVVCGLGGIESSTQQSEVMDIAPLPALHGLVGSRRRKISCVGLCF